MSKYLITGGQFRNKGAESMLFTLITELRKREPDCEIIMSDIGYDENRDVSNYDFKVIKDCTREKKRILNPFLFCFDRTVNFIRKISGIKEDTQTLLNLLPEIDVLFDISGFALGSKWGRHPKRNFLRNIRLAKKFGKKVILMPQSFGPFEFKSKNRAVKTIKKVLSKADMIFCREKDGYDLLKSLGLTNIYPASDLVLQSAGEYSNIHIKEPKYNIPEINEKSVCIIPNLRVQERCDENGLLNLYKTIINNLINRDYSVYITFYDLADKEICENIKSMFSDNEKVIFLKSEMNCIEFGRILGKFDFLISSRFHSIVHSYKNNTPCILIGWAVKYKELAESVGQSKFMFDGIKKISPDDMIKTVDFLIEHLDEEKKIIKENVELIQQSNCFDKIWAGVKE